MSDELPILKTKSELEARIALMVDALTRQSNPDLRVRLLQQQVRLLADRLSMALAIFQNCETEAGIAKDAEGAELWETQRRALAGKDNEAMQALRADLRKWGEYQAAVPQVREFLSRELARVKEKTKEAA